MNNPVIQIIDYQIKQLLVGGHSVLIKKLARLCILVCYFLFAIPVLLIVRLLSPFLVIRFGELLSDRIGHFATFTDLYLCECEKGFHGRNKYDIFYLRRQISNRQLSKMWGRVLNITTLRDLALSVVFLNRFFPGYKKHQVPLERATYDRDFYANISGQLHFTQKEEILGKELLRKIGLAANAPFVCFHVRDSAYLNAVYPSSSGCTYHSHKDCNIKDWSYHSHRDCNIENYREATEELVSRGYFVFRMGAIVRQPLANTNPMIIDYAAKHRTDFLDIFLSAKCQFFIGSVSGIDEVPRVFRRNVASVNCIPLEFIFIWNPNFLFIPKKLFLKNEKRFLGFREIIESGAGRFDCSGYYHERGIEVIENTPEEISDLVIETDQRLKGQWKSTEEDEELQQQFWNILKLSKSYRDVSARIGAQFLRKNQGLLS